MEALKAQCMKLSSLSVTGTFEQIVDAVRDLLDAYERCEAPDRDRSEPSPVNALALALAECSDRQQSSASLNSLCGRRSVADMALAALQPSSASIDALAVLYIATGRRGSAPWGRLARSGAVATRLAGLCAASADPCVVAGAVSILDSTSVAAQLDADALPSLCRALKRRLALREQPPGLRFPVNTALGRVKADLVSGDVTGLLSGILARRTRTWKPEAHAIVESGVVPPLIKSMRGDVGFDAEAVAAAVAAIRMRARAASEQLKDSGNAEFRAKHYHRAINTYSEALWRMGQMRAAAALVRGKAVEEASGAKTVVTMDDIDPGPLCPVLCAQLLTNRGLCRLRLKHYHEAIQDCGMALVANPGNVNAYRRRGIALVEMGLSAQAVGEFEAAARSLEGIMKRNKAGGGSSDDAERNQANLERLRSAAESARKAASGGDGMSIDLDLEVKSEGDRGAGPWRGTSRAAAVRLLRAVCDVCLSASRGAKLKALSTRDQNAMKMFAILTTDLRRDVSPFIAKNHGARALMVTLGLLRSQLAPKAPLQRPRPGGDGKKKVAQAQRRIRKITRNSTPEQVLRYFAQATEHKHRLLALSYLSRLTEANLIPEDADFSGMMGYFGQDPPLAALDDAAPRGPRDFGPLLRLSPRGVTTASWVLVKAIMRDEPARLRIGAMGLIPKLVPYLLHMGHKEPRKIDHDECLSSLCALIGNLISNLKRNVERLLRAVAYKRLQYLWILLLRRKPTKVLKEALIGMRAIHASIVKIDGVAGVSHGEQILTLRVIKVGPSAAEDFFNDTTKAMEERAERAEAKKQQGSAVTVETKSAQTKSADKDSAGAGTSGGGASAVDNDDTEAKALAEKAAKRRAKRQRQKARRRAAKKAAEEAAAGGTGTTDGASASTTAASTVENKKKKKKKKKDVHVGVSECVVTYKDSEGQEHRANGVQGSSDSRRVRDAETGKEYHTTRSWINFIKSQVEKKKRDEARAKARAERIAQEEARAREEAERAAKAKQEAIKLKREREEKARKEREEEERQQREEERRRKEAERRRKEDKKRKRAEKKKRKEEKRRQERERERIEKERKRAELQKKKQQQQQQQQQQQRQQQQQQQQQPRQRESGNDRGETAAATVSGSSSGPSDGNSLFNQLAKLVQMRKEGFLTSEEYTMAKKRILGT